MDARVPKIMDAVIKTFESQLSAFSQKCDEKMGGYFEACFVKTSINPDKFAECLKERQDKLTKLVSPMQSKLSIYFPKKANACLTESKRSVEECTEQVKNGVRQLLENVNREVDRL